MIEMDTDLGLTATRIVRSVDPKQYERMPKATRDAAAAGRGLEEMVELALAFGLTPAAVLTRVVDAIYNECRKVPEFPSKLVPDGSDRKARLVELGDMNLMLGHLRDISGLTEAEVNHQVIFKLHQLRQWAGDGHMIMVDGTIYRVGVR